MPKVFEWNGYRFHFYSNEGDPREPPHIHVTKGRDTAKFWLRPEVVVASDRGFSPKVLLQLVSAIEEHRDHIEAAWHDYFA